MPLKDKFYWVVIWAILAFFVSMVAIDGYWDLQALHGYCAMHQGRDATGLC